MTRSLLFCLGSLILATSAACAKGQIDLDRCRVDGVSARCGTFRVPENRSEKDGRTLELRVVVLPARTRSAEPDPVFFLHGGPGAAASNLTAVFAGSPLRARRDIVLVDQRGTGGSNPLGCPLPDVTRVLQEMATFDLHGANDCRKELDADPRYYVTTVAMQDLDEVRAALGYEKINLLGGSYGTRAALEYLRRYPERARTAILRGTHPPSEVLPTNFDRDSQAALDALIRDCAASTRCNRAYPDLEGTIRTVLKRLQEAPERARIDDPISGERVEVAITPEIFLGAIHYSLYYSQVAASLPANLQRALKGDHSGLVESILDLATNPGSQLELGLLYAILCTEDAPFIDLEQVAREAEGTYLGGRLSRGLLETCKGWPAGVMPEDYKEPVRSEVPVLLISGEVDPVTPPRLAEAAAKTLPNSLHLVLPGIAHGGLSPGCVGGLVERFLDQGSVDGLDTECVREISRPPFRVR